MSLDHLNQSGDNYATKPSSTPVLGSMKALSLSDLNSSDWQISQSSVYHKENNHLRDMEIRKREELKKYHSALVESYHNLTVKNKIQHEEQKQLYEKKLADLETKLMSEHTAAIEKMKNDYELRLTVSQAKLEAIEQDNKRKYENKLKDIYTSLETARNLHLKKQADSEKRLAAAHKEISFLKEKLASSTTSLRRDLKERDMRVEELGTMLKEAEMRRVREGEGRADEQEVAALVIHMYRTGRRLSTEDMTYAEIEAFVGEDYTPEAAGSSRIQSEFVVSMASLERAYSTSKRIMKSRKSLKE